MTYSPATFAKAIVAFIVSGSGALATSGVALNQLNVGTVLAALGVGLTAAAAVFVTPNKNHRPDDSPADVIVNNIPVVVQNAQNALSELDKVKQAATDALGQVPILGPLATQILNSLPKLP